MKLFSKYSNLCDHDTSTSLTDGRLATKKTEALVGDVTLIIARWRHLFDSFLEAEVVRSEFDSFADGRRKFIELIDQRLGLRAELLAGFDVLLNT